VVANKGVALRQSPAISASRRLAGAHKKFRWIELLPDDLDRYQKVKTTKGVQDELRWLDVLLDALRR